MASVGLFRERTFDGIIRSKGDVIEPPYRPYTELQRDPKLMAFNFQASLDEVRELELRAQMHRRRMDDIKETAAQMGIPVGHVLARQPQKAGTPPMFDPEHPSRVNLSEAQKEAEIMDLAGRVADKQRRAAELMQEVTDRHVGPAEGVLRGAGEAVGEAAGTMFAGSAIGGAAGKSTGGGAGRTTGKVVDAAGSVAGSVAVGAAKGAAWAPLAYLGFETDDGPPRRRRYEN